MRSARIIPFLISAVLLLASTSAGARGVDDSTKVTADELLVDATWVPCSDSTESLFIFRDGRAIYALYDQGIIFSLGGGLLSDLTRIVGTATNLVDRDRLDSCTTLGVILDGPRYLLINARKPAIASKDLHERLEQVRRYARKKLAAMDRMSEKASERPDTAFDSEPAVESRALAGLVYSQPIAVEWRCRGSVTVTAMVGADGRVRRAFVQDANVRGKCASLLTMTALRAVLLAPFQAATKATGKEAAAWMRISVAFGVR